MSAEIRLPHSLKKGTYMLLLREASVPISQQKIVVL
jgi:hypothetical protein